MLETEFDEEKSRFTMKQVFFCVMVFPGQFIIAILLWKLIAFMGIPILHAERNTSTGTLQLLGTFGHCN